MKHYYNKLSTSQHIEIIDYLLARGGEILEKNGHYDFHEDDYDCKVVFPNYEFIEYDAYETSFYFNNKEIFHIEGSCGPLIVDGNGETIIGGDGSHSAHAIIKDVKNMVKRFRVEAA